MDKYYVIVAGNGVTSRANLEALMEDHFYANGEHGVVVLYYKDKPSQGQVFAAQFAKDKNKDVLVYTKSNNFDGIQPSTFIEGDLLTVNNDFKDEKSVAFLLWDDEDQDSVNALADLQGIKCFDLTDGLNLMSSADVKRVETPITPEQETLRLLKSPLPEEEDEDEEDEEGEEFDDNETEIMESIYYGAQAIAKVFAEALVEAMADATEKPSKGPTE